MDFIFIASNAATISTTAHAVIRIVFMRFSASKSAKLE
jgi:hypothetical protein